MGGEKPGQTLIFPKLPSAYEVLIRKGFNKK